jgi:hypothetical protein
MEAEQEAMPAVRAKLEMAADAAVDRHEHIERGELAASGFDVSPRIGGDEAFSA